MEPRLTKEQLMYMEDIKQIALKNRVWNVTMLILFCVVVVSLFSHYSSKVLSFTTQLKYKNSEIEVLREQSNVYQKLASDLSVLMEKKDRKDSALLTNVIINGKAIKNIKFQTNDKIISFRSHGYNSWASYFAGL